MRLLFLSILYLSLLVCNDLIPLDKHCLQDLTFVIDNDRAHSFLLLLLDFATRKKKSPEGSDCPSLIPVIVPVVRGWDQAISTRSM